MKADLIPAMENLIAQLARIAGSLDEITRLAKVNVESSNLFARSIFPIKSRECDPANLGECWNLYLATSQASPDFIRKRKSGWLDFVQFCTKAGIDQIGKVNRQTVRAYLKDAGARLAPGTIQSRRGIISLVFSAMVESGHLESNPAAGIRFRAIAQGNRRSLTHDECDKVLMVAEGEYKTLIMIALYTGARLGDILRLEWSAYDSQCIRFNQGKTGGAVCVPAAAQLVRHLAGIRRTGEHILPDLARIYHSRGGSDVSQGVVKVFAAAGIKRRTSKNGQRKVADVSFHSLRHTFASRLAESGCPQGIAQGLLGHKSSAMTAHYSHIDQTTATAAIGAAFLADQ